MAWVTIPDSDLDPDSPITTSLMTALRDNVAAAMNRNTGAPAPATNFISATAMLTNLVVSNEKVANSTLQRGKLRQATAGNEITCISQTERNAVSSSSFTKLKEIKIGIAGTYRITFDFTGDGYTASARIYKNGAAFGTTRTNSGAYTNYSEDLPFAANDLVQLYVDGAIGYTGAAGKVKNFAVKESQSLQTMTIID